MIGLLMLVGSGLFLVASASFALVTWAHDRIWSLVDGREVDVLDLIQQIWSVIAAAFAAIWSAHSALMDEIIVWFI